ncbi:MULTISPECIES: citrate/2-methylcitrate synthase [unclassified Achromobacter]|uniref:citrate/2-methylcitrate synthase n=1 Tax=unclassified Achromobacter TaxID=2626865 RepID=UPI000B516F7C|nr:MULTISPECIES: citrate/2-methylcitrate synthase [unclassified Achromobacter]OWT74718.1 citrate synthase [Achromobacter sp. HZ34]OWT79185.1 citrate synthase [Achromobacter sp. HZ28]
MASWISMAEACSQLGVRPQTVYAYVSRGKLEVMTDPEDTRRSLYRAEDVATLARRKQAGRKHETLATNTLFGSEPSIPTAVSTFIRQRLYYRGQDAVALARTATVEEVAKRLWNAEQDVDFAWKMAAATTKPDARGRVAAFTRLATLAATGHSTRGRTTRVLHNECQSLVGQLADAFGAKQGDAPLHQRFASGWKQPAKVADLFRTAMVLLVDHELTSSAFAARIAASNAASLPACLLTGLTTLAAPLHGDASGRVQALFNEVERLGDDHVIAHYLSTGMSLAGFGHHLYPDGDPRAQALLALFEPPEVVARFIHKVAHLTGLQPNIDAALAALAAHLRLPADAVFGLFATARSVGLLAHSLEQLGEAQVIRPRGRYVGPLPEGVQGSGH